MSDTQQAVADLLAKAKGDLMENMQQRGIGAIVWDNSTAGFHYIPAVVVKDPKDPGKNETVTISGLYRYDGELYLLEEDSAPVSVDQLYNHDTEVKPTVVTLTEETAEKELGDPKNAKGFTTEGSLEEWLTIADCYFEALAE